MTEAEWWTSEDVSALLSVVHSRTSPRKLRMFACDCARRIWSQQSGDHLPRAIERGEQFAEGTVSAVSLAAMRMQMGGRGGYSSGWALDLSLVAVLSASASEAATLGAESVGLFSSLKAVEQAVREGVYDQPVLDRLRQSARTGENGGLAQCVRDIFGNPFRPVAFAPAWHTSTAVAITRGMYESRDFGAMPILADALQDAGCDNDDMLNHCRDANATHVRGCWVVDLVLGKE